MMDRLPPEVLGARLRRTRVERGLSLRQAAAQTGVTKETLSDLERDRRTPHPPTLAKIARGYGVEISDLLGPVVEEESSAPKEPAPPSPEQLPLNGLDFGEERRSSILETTAAAFRRAVTNPDVDTRAAFGIVKAADMLFGILEVRLGEASSGEFPGEEIGVIGRTMKLLEDVAAQYTARIDEELSRSDTLPDELAALRRRKRDAAQLRVSKAVS
jgi:transcriptional regulator with XRE-family HTH domain